MPSILSPVIPTGCTSDTSAFSPLIAHKTIASARTDRLDSERDRNGNASINYIGGRGSRKGRTRRHGFISGPDLELIEVGPAMVALGARRCAWSRAVSHGGRRRRNAEQEAPRDGCTYQRSSRRASTSPRLREHHPPACASSSCARSSVKVHGATQWVNLRCPLCMSPWSRTCLVIGNSYAQVLHAHLLCPVSAEITNRFAQFGQKSMAAVRRTMGQAGSSANFDRLRRLVTVDAKDQDLTNHRREWPRPPRRSAVRTFRQEKWFVLW